MPKKMKAPASRTVGSLAAAHGFGPANNNHTSHFKPVTTYHHPTGHMIEHGPQGAIHLHSPGGSRIKIHGHKDLADRIKHLK
jgi:hypothetical protein